MTVLILTAFMIYRLFDGWGIFHYMTLLSLFTLLFGMVPISGQNALKRTGNTFTFHSCTGR